MFEIDNEFRDKRPGESLSLVDMVLSISAFILLIAVGLYYGA